MAAIAITRSENLSAKEKTSSERRTTSINGEEEKQTPPPPSATADRGTPSLPPSLPPVGLPLKISNADLDVSKYTSG